MIAPGGASFILLKGGKRKLRSVVILNPSLALRDLSVSGETKARPRYIKISDDTFVLSGEGESIAPLGNVSGSMPIRWSSLSFTRMVPSIIGETFTPALRNLTKKS